jgi:hypothetical protein
MKKFKIALVLSVILLFSYGCDSGTNAEFRSEYIVESYLFALEKLPEVRLSRTVPVGQKYDFDEQAVSGTEVTIALLPIVPSSPATLFRYRESNRRGVYLPEDTTHLVLPLRRYQVTITIPEDQTVITSTTIVPDTFQILSSTADTVIFGSGQQLNIDISSTFYPGRQNVFVFSTEALDVTVENLTPFFSDFFDEDEDNLEDFRKNESPPVNEGNYDLNPDGTFTIKVPWISFAFFGRNIISVNAIDDNIFNFITDLTLQSSRSTLSPGELPQINDAIENGTGIFGSYARVKKIIFVKPPNSL